jgi:hypothetical protein
MTTVNIRRKIGESIRFGYYSRFEVGSIDEALETPLILTNIKNEWFLSGHLANGTRVFHKVFDIDVSSTPRISVQFYYYESDEVGMMPLYRKAITFGSKYNAELENHISKIALRYVPEMFI